MVKFISIFTFVLLSNAIFTQSTCLENIKEGRFYYFSDNEEIIVVRKKHKQVEYVGKGKIESKVIWVREDEYLLKIKKIDNVELALIKVDSIVHVKIIGCYENYYDFILSFDNDGEIIQYNARYYSASK